MTKLETMADVRAANEESGFRFFSRENMRFFRTRIASALYAGRYFITSDASSFSNPNARRFNIREVAPDGDIKTVGEYNAIRDIETARERVRELVKSMKKEETQN
jgi:hypothetical protein